MGSDPADPEPLFVRTFVAKARRDRYASLLASPKRRREILDRLNHFGFDVDPRFVSPIAAGADLLALLRGKGAPARCRVVADSCALDGQDVALDRALADLDGCSFGHLLLCIPDRLALLRPEVPGECVLIERRR